jgi:hypothetical protein
MLYNFHFEIRARERGLLVGHPSGQQAVGGGHVHAPDASRDQGAMRSRMDSF